MTPTPLAHALTPSRKAAGVTSLAFAILAAIPLALFLGAEVGLADTRTVDENLAWGSAVVTLGAVAIYGSVPAAVLAILGLEVYTVERIGDLLPQARKRLRQLGLNVRSKHDDGRIGWAEHGPYDGIIVTAAAPALVPVLVEQLAVGGQLVAPVGGSGSQSLVRLVKREDGSVEETTLAPVVFVPLL